MKPWQNQYLRYIQQSLKQQEEKIQALTRNLQGRLLMNPEQYGHLDARNIEFCLLDLVREEEYLNKLRAGLNKLEHLLKFLQ